MFFGIIKIDESNNNLKENPDFSSTYSTTGSYSSSFASISKAQSKSTNDTHQSIVWLYKVYETTYSNKGSLYKFDSHCHITYVVMAI